MDTHFQCELTQNQPTKTITMKKILLILAMAALPCVVFAQGRVAFANTSTTQLRTNLSGAPLFGPTGLTDGASQFYIGLFIAPFGTTDEVAFTLAQIDGTGNPARTFNSVSPIGAGRFNGGNPLAIQGNNGEAIAFQVRAWSASLGTDYNVALSTWATQPASASILLGRSVIGSVTPATGAAPTPNLFGTGAGQIGGFDLTPNPIPEPSSIALGLLGLGALVLFRRRK
jgi:hypothetical protein